MRTLLPLFVVFSGCGRLPEPPSAPEPPGPAVAAPAWLVEQITAEHISLDAASASALLLDESFETLDEDRWQSRDSVAHDDSAGAAAPGAVRMGAVGTVRPRASVHTRVAVDGGQRCYVAASIRTVGLTGDTLREGAALIVRELAPEEGKAQPKQLARYDHMARLVGDTAWTEQQVMVDLQSDTEQLEVLLSGGEGRGEGEVHFDDVSVRCLSPMERFLDSRPVVKAQAASPTGRVRISRTDRPSVLSPGASAWAMTVDRTEGQVLRTHAGLAHGSTDDAKMIFRVFVDGQQAEQAEVKEGRGWTSLAVDLPAQQGTSTLTFTTQPAPGTASDAVLLGAWGDPSLDPVAGWEGKPDIALIILDTLRADDLGVGGNTDRPTSPEMDKLASTGTWYANARSPTSWTLPSIASMLTGQMPHSHGAGWRIRRAAKHRGKSTDSHRRLDYAAIKPEAPRVAERLRDAGYRTTLLASNHFMDRRFGFSQGFSAYGDYAGSSVPAAKRALPRLRDAVERDRGTAGRPQFLVLHMLEPHLPYRYRLPDYDGFELPDVFDYEDEKSGGVESRTLRKLKAKDKKHPEALKVLHQADTRYGDERVRDFLDLVGDDVPVIVVSDHGEAFGEHDNIFLHGDHMYDEVLKVPLIVRWPEGAHPGTVDERPVGLPDVGATLLDWAGLGSEELDGAPLPRPGDGEPPRRQFFEHIYKGYDRVGVLETPHKLIRTLPTLGVDLRARKGTPGDELFDVLADPAETQDLVEAQPETAARLGAVLDAYIDETLPGTHLECAGPHPALTVELETPLLRGVPLGNLSPTVSADRRTVQLAASDSDQPSRLVVEPADGGGVTVAPLGACKLWRVEVPQSGAELDDEQLKQLEAIGYVED